MTQYLADGMRPEGLIQMTQGLATTDSCCHETREPQICDACRNGPWICLADQEPVGIWHSGRLCLVSIGLLLQGALRTWSWSSHPSRNTSGDGTRSEKKVATQNGWRVRKKPTSLLSRIAPSPPRVFPTSHHHSRHRHQPSSTTIVRRRENGTTQPAPHLPAYQYQPMADPVLATDVPAVHRHRTGRRF
jgi:hypothetical protein